MEPRAHRHAPPTRRQLVQQGNPTCSKQNHAWIFLIVQAFTHENYWHTCCLYGTGRNDFDRGESNPFRGVLDLPPININPSVIVKTGTLVILCTWVFLQLCSAFCILYLYSIFCTVCCKFYVIFRARTPSNGRPPPSPTGTKWIHFVPVDFVHRGKGRGALPPPHPYSPLYNSLYQPHTEKKN
jgi:hypothetical protein